MRLTLPLSALILASTASAGTLRVGATPVPAGELLEFVKPILAKQGVELQIREFSDYVQPNVALGEGSLDANLFQHTPYLNAFQQNRPLNIVPVRGVYLPPLGLYSKRVAKVTELRSGATIAIPNDPSNGARALLLLERAGLIRLKPGAGVRAGLTDIVSNVKRLKFRELEAAQLPRSLQDVDAAIVNANYALDIGLSPTKDAIFHEERNSVYVNVLATTRNKAQNPDILKLAAALTSPEARAWLLKNTAVASFLRSERENRRDAGCWKSRRSPSLPCGRTQRPCTFSCSCTWAGQQRTSARRPVEARGTWRMGENGAARGRTPLTAPSPHAHSSSLAGLAQKEVLFLTRALNDLLGWGRYTKRRGLPACLPHLGRRIS